MKTKSKQLALSVAATVSGEDLHRGDYVALLNETFEFPSYLWDASGVPLPAHEPVRLQFVPNDAGEPLKVIAVCLPFVYARTSTGKVEVVDTRRAQLVRLDRSCARAVWAQRRSKSKRPKP